GVVNRSRSTRRSAAVIRAGWAGVCRRSGDRIVGEGIVTGRTGAVIDGDRLMQSSFERRHGFGRTRWFRRLMLGGRRGHFAPSKRATGGQRARGGPPPKGGFHGSFLPSKLRLVRSPKRTIPTPLPRP